jgi:hypothetical protein
VEGARERERENGESLGRVLREHEMCSARNRGTAPTLAECTRALFCGSIALYLSLRRVNPRNIFATDRHALSHTIYHTSPVAIFVRRSNLKRLGHWSPAPLHSLELKTCKLKQHSLFGI